MTSNKQIVHVLPFAELTKIAEEKQPTPIEIRGISKQLFTNAASVESDLGGGAHGHLGAIMDPVEYNLISGGNAWVNPVMPNPFALLPGATAVQIAITKENYET